MGLASDSEVWLWALKIHCGLVFKDQFLEWDRKNPGKKISDYFSPNDPLHEARFLLQVALGDVVCIPNPYGSVFRFDFDSPSDFDIHHRVCDPTKLSGPDSLAFVFDKKGFVVVLRDAQFFKSDREVDEAYQIFKQAGNREAILMFYAWLLEYTTRANVHILHGYANFESVFCLQARKHLTAGPNIDLAIAISRSLGIKDLDWVRYY